MGFTENPKRQKVESRKKKKKKLAEHGGTAPGIQRRKERKIIKTKKKKGGGRGKKKKSTLTFWGHRPGEKKKTGRLGVGDRKRWGENAQRNKSSGFW